jgi:AraC-like DNA-binding protein
MPKHQDFQQEFQRITNLEFFLYCPQDPDTDFVPKGKVCPYCVSVQKIFGQATCRECNRRAYRHACRQGHYHVYRCHAGLLNAVIPVPRNDGTVDAIFLGQVITENDISKTAFSNLVGGKDVSSFPINRLYELFVAADRCKENTFLLVVQLVSMLKEFLEPTQNGLLAGEHGCPRETLPCQGDMKSMLDDHRKPQIVRKVENIIHTQYYKQLSCNEVAETVHLSANYFGTLFKKSTGHSFKDYLNMERIEQSKKLLPDTNRPIKQICAQVGFEDYNYFNRVFKKYTGLPPATYRNQLVAMALEAEQASMEENTEATKPFSRNPMGRSSENDEILQFFGGTPGRLFNAIN